MEQRIKLTALLLALLLLAGCGGSGSAAPDLQAVYDEAAGLPGAVEMIVLEPKRVNSYYGIDTDACPQAIVAVSGDGLRVDEIWLIEAADENAAAGILKAAQGRIEQLCGETENYLPDQYAVAREGQAIQKGKCVALFISPDSAAMAELFEAAFA